MTGSQPKEHCPYHLAHLLSLPGLDGCLFKHNCTYSHPSSLADYTVTAALASTSNPKLKPFLSDALKAAISAQAKSFGAP